MERKQFINHTDDDNDAKLDLAEGLTEEELDIPEDDTEEIQPEPEVIYPALPTMGVVANCVALNVRREPKVEANPSSIVAVLVQNSEVEIDEAASVGEFYKICTAAGIEGYCMKKFIAVKQ